MAPRPGCRICAKPSPNDVSTSRGIKVAPEEVVIVPGGKPIIFFTMLALVEEGDEVIYPNPGFPIYESMINFLGAKAVPIPLREERDFRLDVNELKDLITDRTKLIILNSPQNPTGGIITKERCPGHCGRYRRSRHHGAERRNLQPPDSSKASLTASRRFLGSRTARSF